MKIILISALMVSLQTPSFKEKQLQHARVKIAYQEKEKIVKEYFNKRKVAFTDFRLFLRAFKKEGKLEVWVKPKLEETYTLLTTYDFCMLSGVLGPKRKEGDLQVPEGIYYINHFNPVSNFYLSLGINYPNASDKILSDKQHPGGAIYVHGNCVSIGCIPITDEKIKELYLLAVEARSNGQEKIPVHIFPSRMDKEGITLLAQQHSGNESLVSFCKNLHVIYNDFESTKKLRSVSVQANGEYILK